MDARLAVDGEQWLRARFRHSPDRLDTWVRALERHGAAIIQHARTGQSIRQDDLDALMPVLGSLGAKGLHMALDDLVAGAIDADAFEAALNVTLGVYRGHRSQPDTLMSLRRPMDSR